MAASNSYQLSVRNLGIDTYKENVVYMHMDCQVCRSEGFTALTRVVAECKGLKIIATLNVVRSGLLQLNEVGLSTEAFKRLGASEGDLITVSHLQPVNSLRLVRAKVFGHELSLPEMAEIMTDITSGLYSNIELAAFLTACSANMLSVDEITSLTRAMISSGEKLTWPRDIICDKHCVGGLPGNRTSPVVVSIVAAAGMLIPKTSSRAITSPAGTADTVEVFTNVVLSIEQMRGIVNEQNGCLVWGGSVSLSPADDVLISVEKALDIDGQGQMVASVLSKKAAAGSTHVVIDIPVGKSAKIRSAQVAEQLKLELETVAKSIGLAVKVVLTDGSQPVGRGIGPALEAMDVLSVLRNEQDAPRDLRDRSLVLAGELLELSGRSKPGEGYAEAERILMSGSAYQKLEAICIAQGRFSEPTFAAYRADVRALTNGLVSDIDCRRISKVAKLAGAPKSPRAGVLFLAPLHKKVKQGDVLFSVFADSEGELEYALNFCNTQQDIIQISK